MTAAPQPPRLTLEVGGARFALQLGQTYRVGRAAGCELRLAHATISSQHATLECRENGVLLVDLDSQNGTRVDGSAVQQLLVVPGQKIQFGAIEGRLIDRAAEPLSIPHPTRDPKLRFREANFTELMADEMRRVPWFTLSAVIHLITFLVLYVLFEEKPIGPERERTLTLLEDEQIGNEVLRIEEEPRTEIQEEMEVIRELTTDPLDDALNPLAEAGHEERFEDDLEFDEDISGPLFSGGEEWLRTVKSSAKNILGSAAVSSGGFGKTVSSMRRSGLEIVFVFDSTGSMASILNGTKERIEHIAEMLHALVPDSRIGVVTYRDRDPEEEYLTRKVPLERDVYRSINFMKVISADGGGGRPEAILDGLREAFGLEWGPRARRVVVLIGDAPAHDFDQRQIDGAVRSFVANGQSSVHAIVTSPFGTENLGGDTTESFRRIATIGNGECIAFEDESLVLQQVLSLAFGQEYRKNLDEVSRLVAERRSRIETFALDLVRREDLEQIDTWLRKQPVSDEVVKALGRSQSKRVATHLVDLLTRADLPESSRQAAAHALTRILNGQLERAVTQVMISSIEQGRDARKPPWELGVLTNRGERLLRRAIDEL